MSRTSPLFLKIVAGQWSQQKLLLSPARSGQQTESPCLQMESLKLMMRCCVSHIAALFESCCQAVVTAEAVVVAGGKWAADGESMSAEGELEVDDAMSRSSGAGLFSDTAGLMTI